MRKIFLPENIMVFHKLIKTFARYIINDALLFFPWWNARGISWTMKIRRVASAKQHVTTSLARHNERNRRSNKCNGARGEVVLLLQQVQIISQYRWCEPLRHGALRLVNATEWARAFALKFIARPGLGALINVILCEHARYRCIAKYQQSTGNFLCHRQGMGQFTKD